MFNLVWCSVDIGSAFSYCVDGKLNVHILVTTNRKQMDISYYKNHPYAEKREDGTAQ